MPLTLLWEATYMIWYDKNTANLRTVNSIRYSTVSIPPPKLPHLPLLGEKKPTPYWRTVEKRNMGWIANKWNTYAILLVLYLRVKQSGSMWVLSTPDRWNSRKWYGVTHELSNLKTRYSKKGSTKKNMQLSTIENFNLQKSKHAWNKKVNKRYVDVWEDWWMAVRQKNILAMKKTH